MGEWVYGGRLGECKDKKIVIIEKDKRFPDSTGHSYLYRVSCSWTGKDAGTGTLSPTEGTFIGKFNFYHKLSLFLLFFAPISGRVDSTSCL